MIRKTKTNQKTAHHRPRKLLEQPTNIRYRDHTPKKRVRPSNPHHMPQP